MRDSSAVVDDHVTVVLRTQVVALSVPTDAALVVPVVDLVLTNVVVASLLASPLYQTGDLPFVLFGARALV